MKILNKILDSAQQNRSLFIAAISAVLSFFLFNRLDNNSDALNLLVTAFSILAGFLFIIITITSDISVPSKFLNAQQIYNLDTNFKTLMSMQKRLFKDYILCLALIFLYFLFKKDDFSYTLNIPKLSIEPIIISANSVFIYIISFLSIKSFILSMFLPQVLHRLSEEKIALAKEMIDIINKK